MIRLLAVLTIFLGVLATSAQASAHCDTTRGPVVMAARAALDAGEPNLVLHWVRPDDEAAVREAFQHTIEVRALGPEAKALADRYFFETLVRIHRAGEGAPYTGLTDGEPEPIIAATDRALARGSTDEIEQQLVGAVRAGLAEGSPRLARRRTSDRATSLVAAPTSLPTCRSPIGWKGSLWLRSEPARTTEQRSVTTPLRLPSGTSPVHTRRRERRPLHMRAADFNTCPGS